MTTDTTNTAQLLNGNTGLNTTPGLGRRRKSKMPYKAFKVGNKFEVKKLDADGKPTGKALGTHPSLAKANEQVKALYASENKTAKKELSTTTTTETTTTGTTPVIVDNFEVKTKDYDSWQPEPIPVKVVEDSEMEMGGPTSFADLMAQAEADELHAIVTNLSEQFGQLSCNIMCAPDITDKAAALKALAVEFQDMLDTYVKHEATEETPGEEIEDHLAEVDDDEMEDKELQAIQQIIGDNQPSKDKAKISAAAVNDLPDSDFLYIEPGGKKVDGKTEPRSLRHFPVPDAAHIRNALSRLGQSNTGKAGGEKWLTPALRKTLIAKAQKMLEGENKKESSDLLIWKENGQYHWLAAYSNNRQDDEKEIITSASHKEFDEALAKKEWPMPEVYLWHIPYPVGRADYHAYDESSGFPVAAGHFYPGMDWAAEGILKEQWTGVSHGMPERWIRYDEHNPDQIIRHRTKEISFLPQWAAANKLAFSSIIKEKDMAEELQKGLPAHKRPEFVKMLGEARVEQIEKALEDKSKEADEQGIAKKEATAVTQLEIAEVLTAIKEMFTSVETRLDNLEKSVVKEEDKFDLVAILKNKSIIGKEAAKIDGRSTLAQDKPEETQPEVAGATPIGLINNLLAANQNWNGR